MLPSAFRLREKSSFTAVYAKGRSYATGLVVVYVLPNKMEQTRVGFSVSKKVGNSVVRSRTKRVMREAVRLMLPHIASGCDLVIVARRKAAGATFTDISAALRTIFLKFDIINARDC